MECYSTPAAKPAIETLVAELDVLIRARYPLIAVSTFEELRFRRIMQAVAQLERHAPKGLFLWSRTQGLRQTGGPEDRVLTGFQDTLSVLEHIAQAERGLFLLADYGEY